MYYNWVIKMPGMNFYIPDELYLKIKLFHESPSKLVQQALIEYFEKHREELQKGINGYAEKERKENTS